MHRCLNAAQLLLYGAERATPPVTTNQPYGGVLAHFRVDSLIISTKSGVSNKGCMCFFYHFITGCGHLGAVDLAFKGSRALERAARACTGVDAVGQEGAVDPSVCIFCMTHVFFAHGFVLVVLADSS